MFLSEIPFDQLYVGRPVKSESPGAFGIIEWIGIDKEWHLTESTVCISWENGKFSEFPHCLYDKVIDLETNNSPALST